MRKRSEKYQKQCAVCISEYKTLLIVYLVTFWPVWGYYLPPYLVIIVVVVVSGGAGCWPPRVHIQKGKSVSDNNCCPKTTSPITHKQEIDHKITTRPTHNTHIYRILCMENFSMLITAVGLVWFCFVLHGNVWCYVISLHSRLLLKLFSVWLEPKYVTWFKNPNKQW